VSFFTHPRNGPALVPLQKEPMNQVYSTPQVADLLGVQSSTIRSTKSRKGDQFQSRVHFIKDGQETLWTDAGVELLRQILKLEAPAPALEGVATPGLNLNSLSDAIAWQVIEQALPQQVAATVQRILTTPTEEELPRLQAFLERLHLYMDLHAVRGVFQQFNQDVAQLRGASDQ
jgi:hypothetical protein